MNLMKKLTNLLLMTVFIPSITFAAKFNTVFGAECDTEINGYQCWIEQVWSWALTILIPLSVLVLSVAGVLYMTAGGDEKRVGTAKKMIWGALSGIGLIILARVMLVNVLGLQGTI